MTMHTAIATQLVDDRRAELQRQADAARLSRRAAFAAPRRTSRAVRRPERTQLRRALVALLSASVR